MPHCGLIVGEQILAGNTCPCTENKNTVLACNTLQPAYACSRHIHIPETLLHGVR